MTLDSERPGRGAGRGGALRAAFFVLAIALFAGWALSRYHGPATPTDPLDSGVTTIASLSPAVTEVVFALGAEKRLVAVSDYCVIPAGMELTRAGTALTPNYEVLARIEPGIILAEESKQAPRTELEAIAPTRMIPWLTIQDLVQAVRTIGEIAGESARADSVASRIAARLDVPAPERAPRVLFVLAHDPGQLSECWFIRDNSIHGAALRAAGAQNAIPDAFQGLPRLSLERVLEIDPQAIIVLSPRDDTTADEERRLIADWANLAPLSAARSKAITVVAGDSLYFTGPAVLRLVDRLRDALRDLSASAEGP